MTATGPDGSNRILSGTGTAPDLNPITISVPFSGASLNGNETLVTYTNAVNTGVFKICKASASSLDQDETFLFAWSYTLNGTGYSGVVGLSPGQCGYVTGSLTSTSPQIPVVDNTGAPVVVTVAGDVDTGTWVRGVNYYIASITFAGPGTLLTDSTATAISTFSIGQGTNAITYDNEPCDSNGCTSNTGITG